MLNEVIAHYLQKGVKQVVFDRSLDVSELTELQVEMTGFDDIRSGAFFACGLSQNKNEPVILLVNGDYMASTYTALTEAWFQDRPLLVVAMCASILNKDVEYLKACTAVRYKAQTSKDLAGFFADVQLKDRPVLLLLEEDRAVRQCLKAGLAPLFAAMDAQDLLWIDERIHCEGITRDVKVIPAADRYGMLSKYVGYIQVQKKRTVLVAPYSIMRLDANIFNNRYMSNRFKVVFVKGDNDPDRVKWIEGNGVRVLSTHEMSNVDAQAFLLEKSPCVMIVE